MINSIIITGRLTREPELRYTTGENIPVANFTLAVNRPYNKEQTDFIPCVIWRKSAEMAHKFLRKGQLIGVEGRLEISSYVKEGNTYKKPEVVVERFTFLESVEQGDNTAKPKEVERPKNEDELPFPNAGKEEDDLPF